MVVLTCCAPYGVAGLGRTLSDVTDALCGDGRPFHIFAGGVGSGADLGAKLTCVTPRLPRLLARVPPVRFDIALQQHLAFERFDHAVAKRITTAPASVVAFAGQALHTFRRARKLGCRRLEVVAPTPHLGHVWRQHQLAQRRYSIERDWLNRVQLDRALAEYEMADVIHVATAYTWDTFRREGVPASKLHRIPVSAEPRFAAAPRLGPPPDDVFRIVYTGSLTVVKGVPLLLDAFAGFTHGPAELTLVGSTGTRGMRQFMAERCAQDPRVRVAPGDPLPHLQRAQVYVHPSYQDGFGYAVAEALACGVPAIVTDETGAKELITPGVNGEIIPTDSMHAIQVALERRYWQWRSERERGPIADGDRSVSRVEQGVRAGASR